MQPPFFCNQPHDCPWGDLGSRTWGWRQQHQAVQRYHDCAARCLYQLSKQPLPVCCPVPAGLPSSLPPHPQAGQHLAAAGEPTYRFDAAEWRFTEEAGTVEVPQAALRAAAPSSGGVDTTSETPSFQPTIAANSDVYTLPNMPNEKAAQGLHDVGVAVWRRVHIAVG